jgi:autotransporter-associated beta strand protein
MTGGHPKTVRPGGLSAGVKFVAGLCAACALVVQAEAATRTWSGGGGTNRAWSAGANWGGTAPGSGDAAVFGNAGATNAGAINNTVDAGFAGTVASLAYSNTTNAHATEISAGRTLTVTGALTASGARSNRITGAGGALLVTNASANIAVQAGTSRAVLDLSGLGRFDATISQLQVGGGGNQVYGTLHLARTNRLMAKTSTRGFDIGDSGGNNGGNGQVYLGIANDLFVHSIVLGRGKSGGNILAFNPSFAGSPRSAYIRGSSGSASSRVSTWTLGDMSQSINTGTPGTGHVNDFSGGTLDARADTLIVGQGGNGSATKNVSATFTMTAGTLDANTLYIGAVGSGGNQSGSGTMTVNNSTLAVNTVLELGHTDGTSSPGTTGALNASNSTLRIQRLAVGSGSGSATLKLIGSTLSVSNSAGPVPALDALILSNATLQLTIPTATTTNIAADALTRNGPATVIDIASLPPIASYPARFRLIKYSTLSGSLNFTRGALPAADPAYQGYISNSTGSAAVDLVLTGGPVPTNVLVWTGTGGGAWDAGSTNWLLAGSPAAYADGTPVRFDDTAVGATTVRLATALFPASVTISNNALAYTFAGTGSIGGLTALLKQGTNALALAHTGANSFAGGVTVAGGTLQIGTNNAGGGFGAGSVVNNGAIVFHRSDSFTVAAAIGGSGSVTKLGGGALTLSGTNTYTGPTWVNAGRLTVNGRIGGGGTLTSAGGTYVSGGGTHTGPVVVGGTLQPGGSGTFGTFTSGTLTLGAGAVIQLDLNADNTVGAGINDLLVVNGNLAVSNNTLSINMVTLPRIGVPYRLIQYTGARSGSFNPAVQLSRTNYTCSLDYGAAGQVRLTFTSGVGSKIPAAYPTGPGPCNITLGSDGKLVYTPDASGDIIPDFSKAGYRGGDVPIPYVPVVTTLVPVAGNNYTQIQNAINALKARPLGPDGLRGAVLLKAGVYVGSGTVSVNGRGIVLRGEGEGTNGTILRGMSISISGGSRSLGSTQYNVVSDYVPLGANWFTVDSTNGLAPGDEIQIVRPSNGTWLQALYPPDGKDSWVGAVDIRMYRKIVAIEEKRVLLDAPVVQSLDRIHGYGGASFNKATYSGTEDSGIEYLRVDRGNSAVDTNGNTGGVMMDFGGVQNCWVRHLYNDRMNGHTMDVGGARYITVEDVTSFHMPLVYRESSATVQNFTFSYGGQGIHFHRCVSQNGGSEFTSGPAGSGPTVFSECTIPQAVAFTGPHMKWTVGVLYDAIYAKQPFQTFRNDGSHGWGGGNHIAWNCEASSYHFDRPPTAHQWNIGCLGPVSSKEPRSGALPCERLSQGVHVEPGSLFRAQLSERIGAEKTLAVLGAPAGANPFTLVPTGETARTVLPGQGASYPIRLVMDPDRYGKTVSFSVTNLPAGLSASFSPGSFSTNGVTTLTVNTTGTLAKGIYYVRAQGTGTFTDRFGSNTVYRRSAVLPLSVRDFFVAATPSERSMSIGSNSTTFAVGLVSAGGFTGSVALSVSGLPAGSSASFAPPSVSPGQTSILTVATTPAVAPDRYDLAIAGAAGGDSDVATVRMNVGDFFLAAVPTALTLASGASGAVDVAVGSMGVFTQSVSLGASNLPAGVSVAFSPDVVAGGAGLSLLTVSAAGGAVPGAYTVTVHAAGGGAAHAVGLNLGILPAGWTGHDIGLPGRNGYASAGGTEFTVRGGGQDIYGDEDHFHFAFQSVTSDVTVLARVVRQDHTDPWAKAGVMLRETADADSAFVDVVVAPSNGVSMQYRSSAGAGAANVAQHTNLVAPYWVKIVRVADSFSGYRSSDGTNWTLLSTVETVMSGPVLAGLAVTAHDDDALGAATFDNVQIVPHPFRVSVPDALLGVAAGGSNACPVDVAALNGFSDSVTLSASGLASGVTGAFDPSVVAGTGVSSFRVTAAGAAASGLLPVAIHGRNGGFDIGVPLDVAVGNFAGFPPGWADLDIGAPARAGGGAYAGGAFIVRGGGSDIWNAADQFNFAFRSWNGDAAISARVAVQPNTNPWAKSGVMIRSSADAGSACVGLYVTPGNGVSMQYRPSAGGGAVDLARIANAAAPQWVRLIRYGDRVAGDTSGDGIAWTPVGSIDVALPSRVFAGLAVTAHDVTKVNTSVFDNVSIAAPPGFSLEVSPPDLQASVGDHAAFAVTVSGTNGFSGEVELTVEGAPVGADAGFAPASSITDSGASTLVVELGDGVEPGAYELSVTASNGPIVKTARVLLNVGDFQVSADPDVLTLLPGDAANLSVVLEDDNGFAGTVELIAEGLPPGVGASFVPSVAAVPSSATLALTSSAAATPGLYSLDIAAEHAGIRRSFPVTLEVGLPGTNLLWTSTGSGVWDVGGSTNWMNLNLQTPGAFHQGDQVFFGDAVGATTNVTIGAGVTVQPATVAVVANLFDYRFSGAGRIGGDAGILKKGSGTLTLGGSNSFGGATSVSGGTLRVDGVFALGSTAGPTTIAGGTLDVGGPNLAANTANLILDEVFVEGRGAGGGGAIVNNGSASQNNALQYVTLSGDATFGGSQRWDVRAGSLPYVNLNGFTLTKEGTNQISFVRTEMTNAGDVIVNNGSLGYENNSGGGAYTGPGTTYVNPAGSLGVYGTTLMTMRVQMNGGAIGTLSSGGGPSAIGSPIAIATDSFFAAQAPVTYTNVVYGAGGIVKTGTGVVTFAAACPYEGPTTVSNGTLALAGSGSIGGSDVIAVEAGAALDVAARVDGTLSLVAGQTLQGAGTVRGSLLVGPGATVAPGASTGALTVTNQVTLQGTTVMELNKALGTNDQIRGAASVQFGGTLILTNASGMLTTNDRFRLFSAGAYAGSFAAIRPAIPGLGLAWNTSDLATSGTVAIVSSPTPQPTLGGPIGSGAGLRVGATNGVPGWTYFVLTSTNLLSPLSDWTRLQTNVFDDAGSALLAPVLDPERPQSFYLLQLGP